MRRFAACCEAIAATQSKNEKIRLAAEYLRALPVEEAARAALFLSGRVFPRYSESVLDVGASAVWQALTAVAPAEADQAHALYRKHGDLGAMAAEMLAGGRPTKPLALAEAAVAFEEIARRRGPTEKARLLESLLRRVTHVEAKYLIKVITGELRIGLRESLVEEAVAQAYGRPPADVRRANMFLGDLAAVVRLAALDNLNQAQLTPFRPVACMLAAPIEAAGEAVAAFPSGALVEDKFDGVRTQVHKQGGVVKLYSRTLDRLVEFFELEPALASIGGDFILDGEIVGWRNERPLPFTELQRRLGRKSPDLFLPLEVPVLFVAFDLLWCDGVGMIDQPLSLRRRRLEALLASAPQDQVRLAPCIQCQTEADYERAFQLALARGNEGIVIKSPESPYTPGRRGRAWLKWKQPLATLDVVVTAVEYGHGKRAGLLSDYTFAVRSGKKLLNIGKAYSGLTDEEINRLTAYFIEHTVRDEGARRIVKPELVIEVAFNQIQRSERHASGFALRFPRIVRLRPDKSIQQIDTIERVRQLYARQAHERA